MSNQKIAKREERYKRTGIILNKYDSDDYFEDGSCLGKGTKKSS